MKQQTAQTTKTPLDYYRWDRLQFWFIVLATTAVFALLAFMVATTWHNPDYAQSLEFERITNELIRQGIKPR